MRILAPIILLLCSVTAVAETSMFKVSKNGDYFYLGGTIHLLEETDYPLPEEFAEAYADADEVVFETDVAGANTPAFQLKLVKLISYDDDRTLQSELKPHSFDRLRQFTESRGMPVSMFLKFKPWGVALTITLMEYQLIGLKPELGVEQYFSDLAAADGKDIQSLESIDEQLEFISAMAGEDPDDIINYTLDELDTIEEQIRVMKEDWRKGDLDAVAENAMVVQMKSDFPDFYNILLKNRNDNWMKDLVTYFDDDKIEIVMVGAMHLPGEDGLLIQLSNKGYIIEQIP